MSVLIIVLLHANRKNSLIIVTQLEEVKRLIHLN